MIPSAPTALDRLMVAVRALIRAEVPRLTFLGSYEYAIQGSQDHTTVDIAPTDTTLGLPSLTKVPLRSSVLGEAVAPSTTAGQRCLVSFVNGDPTRPFVYGIDPIPDKATVDAKTELDLGPSAGAVNIAGGANALAPAPWASSLATALGAFAAALTASTTLANVIACGGTLTTSLGTLPPSATTKTKAT